MSLFSLVDRIGRVPHTAVAATLILSICGITSGFALAHPLATKAITSTIYVSPSGNDSNSGTVSRPLRTLVAARNAVRRLDRSMSSNITVYLESGTYRLTSPLALGPQDSGSNGHHVVWSAAPGAQPVVAGSKQIKGWRSVSGSSMWVAKVPASLRTRQIYVNGQRATLASGPVPTTLTATSTGYVANSSVMSHWRNPSDIDFVYTAQLGLMVEPICPLASIHGTTITMARPCWNNSNQRTNNIVGFGKLGQPAYVENAFELLKKPGQFYLDRSSRKLYYIPFPGQNMKTADVEAPVLQSLVVGKGTASSPLHDITFSGIQFSYATWLQPSTPTGFSEMQDNFSVTGSNGGARQGLCATAPGGTCPFGNWSQEPGNVAFTNDHSVTFSGDQFVHLGGAGLELGDGSQNDKVSASVFTDISGNGLELGGVDAPEASRPRQTAGNSITDNHLFGVPAEYHGGVALWVGYASRTLIAHNQIDHVPYSGISIGWGGWPDKKGQPAVANYSHNNVISDNLIYDFMQTLSDGGGVYTLGITGSSLATGEKVSGNVVHDQLAWGRAMQNDDGATYVSYHHNALWNNSYDYGTIHVDFSKHQDPRCVGNPSPSFCTFDPASVTKNYWQQGDPTTHDPGVTVSGNTLISSGNMVPTTIVHNAGIESADHDVVLWTPSGENNPSAPEEVSTLYAFAGKAWVSWRPSYLYGKNPVSSYTVTACRASAGIAPNGCSHPAASVNVPTAGYQDAGYVVVTGLKTGQAYSFIVVAHSSSGSSTPSIPSTPVTIGFSGPAKPNVPKSLDAMGGSHLIRLIWYAPAGSATNPVTGFKVSVKGGSTQIVTGLRPLIVSNSGGRVVFVLSGLTPGKPYSISVAAMNPSGTGPSAAFPPTKPTR